MPVPKPRTLFVVLIALVMVGSAMTAGAVVSSQHAQESDTQQTSYLRVVHASPDAPAVDVYVENDTVLENVSFSTVSDYLSLQAGTYNVSITAAGDASTVVFDDQVTLEPRMVTTVAASGEISEDAATSFEPVFFDDNAATPGMNQSAIRIVHLSPDAPTVDVTAADGSVVLADNISYQEASDYVTVPAGDYTAEIRAATEDNNGSIVTTVDVSLEEKTAYSALAIGYLNPDEAPMDTPFQVVATEDATSSVHLPSDTFPAAIRVLHTSPDAPTVDVTAADGSVVLADNISYGEASDYVTVPAGDYTAEIRAATEDNNGSIVTTVDVSLEEGMAYSAVAVGFLNPDDETADRPFEVLLQEDGTEAVQMPLEPVELPEDEMTDEDDTDSENETETTTEG